MDVNVQSTSTALDLNDDAFTSENTLQDSLLDADSNSMEHYFQTPGSPLQLNWTAQCESSALNSLDSNEDFVLERSRITYVQAAKCSPLTSYRAIKFPYQRTRSFHAHTIFILGIATAQEAFLGFP